MATVLFIVAANCVYYSTVIADFQEDKVKAMAIKRNNRSIRIEAAEGLLTTRRIPELSAEIGENESNFLLQIDFLISISNTPEIDGHQWTYQTLEDMQKYFPTLSRTTLHRTAKNLIERGLLLRGNHNKHAYDKTSWYAIDWEEVAHLKSVRLVNGPTGIPLSQKENTVFHPETTLFQDGTPIPENTQIDV